jgi:peptidoglycan/LPS O-acetylase OafA/YrhL
MLSGFVIAHNYDSKIQNGMTLREFMLHRFIRLYPCYVLAFALGVSLGGARLIRNAGFIDGAGLAGAALPNLFMLPSLTSLYGQYDMYPFNGSSWSLLFELIANAMYWLLFRLLTGARLAVLLLASAAAYIAAAKHVGTVDLGMRSGEALEGICRVTLTFFAGLAIRRYVHNRVRISLGPLGIMVAVAGLILTFYCSEFGGETYRLIAELVAVMILYPVLLMSVSNTVPGARLAPICRFSGNVSYPVYILQTPMFFLFAAIPEVAFHHKAILWAPTFGIVEVMFVVGFAWCVDRRYELPLRKLMKVHLLPARQTPVRVP